ncbi:hypothetical protein L3X38_026611 [Prunus dulcis]|uniref:Uncharacterized protein n=1 Tax=Prunus dulcis TaxID=3755 RepID=A0AAD4VLB8_PRUDU|nr:hypothetical protein L3X38_026611 [Prunus dulcis]
MGSIALRHVTCTGILSEAIGCIMYMLLEPLQRCSPARGEGRPRRKSGSSVAPRPGFGVGPTNSGQPEGQTSPRSKTRLLTSASYSIATVPLQCRSATVPATVH